MSNRIGAPCPPCIEGIQDELVLAVTILDYLGFSKRQLKLQFDLNKNTLTKIAHGGILTRMRDKYRMQLYLALKVATTRAYNSGGKIIYVKKLTNEKYVFTKEEIDSLCSRFVSIAFSYKHNVIKSCDITL